MNKLFILSTACAMGVMLIVPAAPAAPLPITDGSWTLAILPDTQVYAQSYPSIFNAQTQFLANYQDDLNLAFVLQEGDVTNNNVAAQWVNASNAFQILDNAGVNYAIAPGNHDYGTNGSTDSRASLMANYFPVSRLDDQPTFGGVYPGEPNSPLNSYSLFSAGDVDYLVLALEFGPRNQIVDWADGLMKTYSNRQTMIVTHANLYNDSTRYDWAVRGTSQSWNPHNYSGVAGNCNDGQEMWQKLKDNANLKFIFNGHVLNDGAGYLADTGDNGNVVHNLLANYQFVTNGGNGYMRLLEFMPDGKTVHVRTYSPTLDSYLTNPDQDFVFSLNSLPPLLRHAVGANLVVAGATKPSDNVVGAITVPQSGSPQVGPTWQVNRGDYEITVGNEDLTYKKGVLLASVTQDLRDGYRATVEVGRNSYSDEVMALSLMQAGYASGAEVNFNTSTAWFEFAAGWQAAHLNADATIAAGEGITASMIGKNGTGRYSVDLGVDSRNDGMLFVIGNNNSNKIVDTGVLSDGGGWDVRVQNNAANFSATGTDAAWSMVYLPYDTENLIGGRYDGIDGKNLNWAGTFTMTKLDIGQYRLTIPGESPETGMLILSVAYETSAAGLTAPDDNILNYESDGLGNFIIRSFDLTGTTTLSAQNTQFVWAYIDFSNPICIPVPEPPVWLLLLTPALVFAFRRYKKWLAA